MVFPCISAVLMGILTVGFVLADINFMYGKGAVEHALLGSLVTILFYVLCVRGYELINWIFIGIFLTYLLASILYKNLFVIKDDTTDNNMGYEYCTEPIYQETRRQNKAC
jgi:hypothetical protein